MIPQHNEMFMIHIC